jgi:sortase A
MRRAVALLLALLGCASFGHGLWIEAKAWLAQGLIAGAWAQTHADADHVRPWSWADTWPVARLSVPRLGLERMVLAGVSGRTLAFGPGWAQQTAPPGAPGRTLIAGHRDTHFRFLDRLVRGDLLILQDPARQQVRYRVVETAVVDERAMWLMEPGDERELLLVTCYPFDALLPGGDQRYLVRALAEPDDS